MEWYNWLLSVFLFIVIPCSVIVCRLMTIKVQGKKGCDKKCFVINLIKSTCFYWLLGAFHLCAIFGVLLWTFIFGGLAMVTIFYNLANAFIRQNVGDNALNKIGLLQDFIVGIILTVYLIYIIPKEGLQTIVTAIVAAVYGGLLTLVGVACTIRHDSEARDAQETARYNERILEEKKKYKPIFNFYNGNEPDNSIDIQADKFDGILDISSRFTGDISKTHKTVIRGFIIENTNYVEFYFRGIKINTREYETNKNIFVNKNAYLWIDFDNEKLYLDEPVKELYMIVEDLLGNIYNVWLGIEVEEQDGVSYITVIGSKRINIEEYINE